MEYIIGDIIKVRINKIQDNGCYCSFLPLHCKQYGFMPKNLMPSMIDAQGNYMVSVGDDITVVIEKNSEKGFLLSDIETYEKEQEKLHKKEQKAILKQHIESFASKYTPGTIFEAEVVHVQNTKVTIKVGDVQGIIKKEDTNWNEIDRLNDLLFEGELIEAVYLKYENDQLFFSLKLLNEKPYDDKLYDLSLFELLRYAGHDSNVFIGQAKQYHYGLFIENLYSVSNNQKGKLLIDPIFGYNLRAIVQNANFNVEENKYYKIELRLAQKKRREERNQLFQFTAINIEETENPYKADVDLTFAKSTSPRDCAALAHTLAEVGKNMYSSKDRMFFELIQNADDAAAQKGVYVNVKSQGDFLIVRHNGNSFDKDDFDAITSSANGTKKANENKTGYKGIGFKSVFTDSEIVYIKTGGYQFKFDRNEPIFANFEQFYFFVNGHSTDQQKKDFLQKFSSERLKFRGVADIPWQLEPIWVDNYPEELGNDFSHSNVSIALKLGEYKIVGDNGYNKAIEDIIRNPRFMLFLRNTKRIDFNGFSVSKNTKNGRITLKNSFSANRIEYFKREDFEIEVNNEIFEKNNIDIRIIVEELDDVSGKIIEAKFVDINNHELENIPKKIAINNSTVISFAVPIEDDGILMPNMQCNEISMFAFLPTLVKDFKFPFYINANFILDPPRQRILGDNPWNLYLMQEIARCLVRWSASLNEKQDKNALNVLLCKCFEEDSADTKQLAEHFNSAYKSAIKSEAFILNYKGELSRIDEIILDIPGLSKLIGEDLFCKYMGTNKKLPSKNIDSRILQKGIFADIVEKLGIDDVLERITDNSDFNYWFISATDEQKEIFYRWLNWIKEKGYEPSDGCLEQLVSSLPLFKFKKEYKSCKEIELSNYIITTEHIVPIKEILSKLDFVCSDNVFNEKHPLFGLVELSDEKELFEEIILRFVEQDGAGLTAEQKLLLFKALSKLTNIGKKHLSEIEFFNNSENQRCSLNNVFSYNGNAPKWAEGYMISKEENFPELQDYLQKEFDVIWKNIDVITVEQEIPITEVYEKYKWTDEQYTIDLIDRYKKFDEIFSLVPIVEDSRLDTQLYFLENVSKLELFSTKQYDKDSIEYRVLQLALKTLSNPSDFSSKIYFDGQCIKDFTVSDDVICEYIQNGVTKKPKMSLAKLLPQYQNLSDSIEKIKRLFESKKDLDKFFVAKPKPLNEVYSELNTLLRIQDAKRTPWVSNSGNAYQYLFSVYKRKQVWSSLFGFQISLKNENDEFVTDLMNWLCKNKIQIKLAPFTYHLKTYFENKYFNCDYVSTEERLLPIIEQWADNDEKKQYLIENGVREKSCLAIQFRKLFLENKTIDFLNDLSDEDIASGIKFIATVDGFDRPFIGNYQKEILLRLKEKECCNLEDNVDNKKLKENFIECEYPRYKTWVNNSTLRIFISQNMIPNMILYNNILLLNYDDYRWYYNDKTKELFVKENDLKNVLWELVDNEKIPFSMKDYTSLFPVVLSDDYETLCKENKELKDEKADLIKENEALKKMLEQYNVPTNNLINQNANIPYGISSPTITKVCEHGLDDKGKLEAQLEAQKRLIEEFPEWTFPNNYGECDENGKPYNFSTIEVEDNNGMTIPIVLKSYKNREEPFKINTQEWDYLIKEYAVLLIYTGDDIKRIYVRDLVRKQSNIAITFSTENLDLEDRVNAFADSLHYFNELHFDFESFNISESAKSAAELYHKNKRAFFNNDDKPEDNI